jgi:SAM-dependent methyltransferase
MKNVDHQEDITRMTFANSSFDFIYCSNVLEHVLDDRSAMSELFRVLAPGGRLVIQVPIRGDTTYENPAIVSPAERAAHFGQADHVRFYGRDIRVRLEDAGFYVEECYLQEKLAISSMQMARMNVGVRELLHLCSKRQSNGSAVAWPAASQSNVS